MIVSSIPKNLYFLFTNFRLCFCFAVGIPHTLLTVLGFVVSLSSLFRISTAYERYIESRKAWEKLAANSQTFARNIWINSLEEGDHAKEDLLGKVSVLDIP